MTMFWELTWISGLRQVAHHASVAHWLVIVVCPLLVDSSVTEPVDCPWPHCRPLEAVCAVPHRYIKTRMIPWPQEHVCGSTQQCETVSVRWTHRVPIYISMCWKQKQYAEWDIKRLHSCVVFRPYCHSLAVDVFCYYNVRPTRLLKVQCKDKVKIL